jgi:adenylate kinase family enzyme
MASILVTGMSAAGKSTCLAELARRGFETVDTDEGDWIEVVHGEPLWQEARMSLLLSRPRAQHLVVAGTVANQGRFYDSFEAVVLLSAPIDVIVARLRTRTTNDFGKSAVEQATILRDIAEFEPVLRSGATHELDTTRPVEEIVASIVAIADGSWPPAVT